MASALAATLLGSAAGLNLMAYLIAHSFGMGRYAFLNGIIYAFFCLDGALGPSVAGISFDISGRCPTPIWSAILLRLAAALALGCLPRLDRVPGASLTVPLRSSAGRP